MVHRQIRAVTDRIVARSAETRGRYLEAIHARAGSMRRSQLGCANLAHAMAACSTQEKTLLGGDDVANIAIVTSYNDMLSAHRPYARYPDLIKAAVAAAGGVAQVAGGVPAMCDGVTQGRAGMELSLFSRDVIAMATAVALSHDVFDGALFLGVCDKIVPGLLIAALSFGHLPGIFVPAGPMPSGLSNSEKSRIREMHAEGKVDRATLLAAESAAYHGAGTCTFYGTANSNQMLMEIMGLQLPGGSFVHPDTELRDALTEAAAGRILQITDRRNGFTPIGEIVDERAIVNGIVGLLATGGSTNHTIHLTAMARAAGIQVDWHDFADLSDVVPLLARIYPNGTADVNSFEDAGGMPILIGSLLDHGLLHDDVRTVWGQGLTAYRARPRMAGRNLVWHDVATESSDMTILRSVDAPFCSNGGIRILAGNVGRAVTKVSAIDAKSRVVEAPALVFRNQESFLAAFKAGKLHRDVVVVVTHQGPVANGMPELHKLMPPLGVLQNLGFAVALVTDGRMSGASGKVPAAIHVTPEAACGGGIGKIRDGDVVRLDTETNTLTVLVDAAEFSVRDSADVDLSANALGTGRELFSCFRRNVSAADRGASVFT